MTPAEHFLAAERLLADAESDMASPIFGKRVVLADVHAKLAQCAEPYDEYDEDLAVDCMVARSRVTTVHATGDRL
jgi:hypothetical protein